MSINHNNWRRTPIEKYFWEFLYLFLQQQKLNVFWCCSSQVGSFLFFKKTINEKRQKTIKITMNRNRFVASIPCLIYLCHSYDFLFLLFYAHMCVKSKTISVHNQWLNFAFMTFHIFFLFFLLVIFFIVLFVYYVFNYSNLVALQYFIRMEICMHIEKNYFHSINKINLKIIFKSLKSRVGM